MDRTLRHLTFNRVTMVTSIPGQDKDVMGYLSGSVLPASVVVRVGARRSSISVIPFYNYLLFKKVKLGPSNRVRRNFVFRSFLLRVELSGSFIHIIAT